MSVNGNGRKVHIRGFSSQAHRDANGKSTQKELEAGTPENGYSRGVLVENPEKFCKEFGDIRRGTRWIMFALVDPNGETVFTQDMNSAKSFITDPTWQPL